MNSRTKLFLIILSIAVGTAMNDSFAQKDSTKPEPKVIKPDIGDKDYVRILSGPPESYVMKSGMVQLLPGKTVGKHSTENSEELILVLQGEGIMILNNEKKLEMKEGTLVYCPPNTEHDVKNICPSTMKYIYIVAKTK